MTFHLMTKSHTEKKKNYFSKEKKGDKREMREVGREKRMTCTELQISVLPILHPRHSLVSKITSPALRLGSLYLKYILDRNHVPKDNMENQKDMGENN